MKRGVGFIATAALFLSAGWLGAQETYRIKLPEAAQGDVAQIDKTETATVMTKVVDATGKALLEQKQVVTETTSYVETVKKCEPKKTPTLLERKYDKAVTSVDGKQKELPYQGKTVVIERKGDKCQFTVDGKELTGEDAQSLTKEFAGKDDDRTAMERALLPKDPVKLNDSWKLDMAPFVKDIAKSGEIEVNGDKAKGNATLLKVYKKDGKQFGEIKVELSLPLKSLGKGNMALTAQDGSVAKLEMNLDVCLDGTSHNATGKTSMTLDATGQTTTGDGTKLTVSVSIQSKGEETQKEVPKK
jgi:hypothetical protein